jgi:uncharacterized protein (AIM24 family)
MYYLAINGQQQGPYTAEQINQMISSGQVKAETLAFTQGMATWTPLIHIAEFRPRFAPAGTGMMPPPVPATTAWNGKRSHEIDFEIFGDDLQFVEITLDPNETVIAEAGSMMYMSQGVQMGESLFMTAFTARGGARDKVAFAAPYPGKIVPMDLSQLGGTMICQKQSFLCAAKGTSIGIEFTRRLGAGLFGGEGFILERLTGDGLAFVHAGGTIVEKDLRAGETLRVDTGCLVAFQPSVAYDIQFVGGFKNTLFGGEGLFFATLTGPGRVYLQSLPFSRLADRIFAAAPRAGGSRVEEGSLLGGLGNLLDGNE